MISLNIIVRINLDSVFLMLNCIDEFALTLRSEAFCDNVTNDFMSIRKQSHFENMLILLV